jgi:hypothetical protein
VNIQVTWDPEDPWRIIAARSKKEITYRNLPLLVQKALDIATEAHRYQLRADGKTPYIIHVWQVLYIAIVCEWRFSDEELAAFCCHDVIEDTMWPFDNARVEKCGDGILYARDGRGELAPLRHLQFAEMEKRLGTETASIVWLMTKPEGKPFRRRIYVASLHRVAPTIIAGKFADTLSNLQRLPPVAIYTKVEGSPKKCWNCHGHGVTHSDVEPAKRCPICDGTGIDNSDYHVTITKEDPEFATRFKQKVREDYLPLIPILKYHGTVWHNVANWFEIRLLRHLI